MYLATDSVITKALYLFTYWQYNDQGVICT